MSNLNQFRQKHRLPSRDQVRRRQAHHQFDRRTQRLNHEIPGLSGLPVVAALANQELSQGMATHDLHVRSPEHAPRGHMVLRDLVRSPHFQAGLHQVQPQPAQ